MGHMEKLWDKAVAKESYSANGDLDYDDEIDDFDAYAATEEGVCWCGNDGCGHIQDNPQKQCCVCTDASDVDSMCGECRSQVESYSAASAMTRRSYIRPQAVATHRGIDIIKVGNSYRIFFPVVGSPGLTRRTFPSVQLAKDWIDEDPEIYATTGDDWGRNVPLTPPSLKKNLIWFVVAPAAFAGLVLLIANYISAKGGK